MDARADLYAPIEPYDSGMLSLDDVHTMYWETSGNPVGVPVVFLHGGPGGGCAPSTGAFSIRRSTASCCSTSAAPAPPRRLPRSPTTPRRTWWPTLKRLRDYLGISQWLLFGGSWGSTLALAYGQTHPDRCLGFVLRGVFLGRPSEVDWFFQGARQIHPEASRRFTRCCREAERGDLLRGYLRRLFDPDPKIHMPFARAWSEYEGTCSTLIPNPDLVREFSGDALALARLEAHYFEHHCFLSPNQLLANLYRIEHLPASIVHSRYDVVCPIVSADELARAWPGARFTVIADAGHSVWEPSVRTAVVREVELFKRRLAPRSVRGASRGA
jgi:proline iminopeptidase